MDLKVLQDAITAAEDRMNEIEELLCAAPWEPEEYAKAEADLREATAYRDGLAQAHALLDAYATGRRMVAEVKDFLGGGVGLRVVLVSDLQLGDSLWVYPGTTGLVVHVGAWHISVLFDSGIVMHNLDPHAWEAMWNQRVLKTVWHTHTEWHGFTWEL